VSERIPAAGGFSRATSDDAAYDPRVARWTSPIARGSASDADLGAAAGQRECSRPPRPVRPAAAAVARRGRCGPPRPLWPAADGRLVVFVALEPEPADACLHDGKLGGRSGGTLTWTTRPPDGSPAAEVAPTSFAKALGDPGPPRTTPAAHRLPFPAP